MYERLLNKEKKPTFEEMVQYSGDTGRQWIEIENFLRYNCDLQTLLRFPYGNKFGWGVKYSQRNKHICDIFAEANAFTVFFRIENVVLNKLIDELNDYTKVICENRYPCGEGGWLRYRVLSEEHLKDVIKLLSAKLTSKK